VTLILIKPFAIRFTKGLKKYLILNLEAIFYTILWVKLKYLTHILNI